jgi:hypothetical protein
MGVFGYKPECVGHALHKVHRMGFTNGVFIGAEKHRHLFNPVGIAIDKRVISDILHNLASVLGEAFAGSIAETLTAELYCLIVCSEEHGTEAVLHLPYIVVGVLEDCHRLPLHCLQEETAFVIAVGIILDILRRHLGSFAVVKFEFHKRTLLCLI